MVNRQIAYRSARKALLRLRRAQRSTTQHLLDAFPEFSVPPLSFLDTCQQVSSAGNGVER